MGMKKKFAILLLAGMLVSLLQVNTASANLNDTRATIAARYGDYRLVLDKDHQLWTRDEWEKKGIHRAEPLTYEYAFERQGIDFRMEVSYAGKDPQALVTAQRFTPAWPFKVKELKKYLPEIYDLISSPKAVIFATKSQLTQSFQEIPSPVTLGVVIEDNPVPNNHKIFTLLSFCVRDEGRLIKEIPYLDREAEIREIVLERAFRADVKDNLDSSWVRIPNLFQPDSNGSPRQ